MVRAKTDYKEILSEPDFAIFAKLRDVRKAIAQSEAVPVYTIFTNEQLAQMVTSKATTRAALAKIDGLGRRQDWTNTAKRCWTSSPWPGRKNRRPQMKRVGNLFDAIVGPKQSATGRLEGLAGEAKPA